MFFGNKERTPKEKTHSESSKSTQSELCGVGVRNRT